MHELSMILDQITALRQATLTQPADVVATNRRRVGDRESERLGIDARRDRHGAKEVSREASILRAPPGARTNHRDREDDSDARHRELRATAACGIGLAARR